MVPGDEKGGESGSSVDFKVKVDLYDLLKELKDIGYDNSHIGLLYVSAVRSLPRRIRLSNYSGSNIKTERQFKKSFEDGVRDFFKGIRNEALRKKTSRDKILDTYLPGPDQNSSVKGTIEGSLEKILEKGETTEAFASIGEAVIKGSRAYLSEKPSKLGAYKVFLEYNRILTKLNELL